MSPTNERPLNDPENRTETDISFSNLFEDQTFAIAELDRSRKVSIGNSFPSEGSDLEDFVHFPAEEKYIRKSINQETTEPTSIPVNLKNSIPAIQQPAPLITLLDRSERRVEVEALDYIEPEKEQPSRLLQFATYDGDKILHERLFHGYKFQKFSREIESTTGDLTTATAYVDQAIQFELREKYCKAINEYNQACRFLRGFMWVLDPYGDQYKLDIRALENIIHQYSSRIDDINPLAFAEKHRPIAPEEDDDNLSETCQLSGTASLAPMTDSVFSMLSASSMSSALAAGPQGAAERLVSLFLTDVELNPLFIEALSYITPARFERNFRRLLKEFAIVLRKEADTVGHRQAANFVRYRSRNTAHIICNKIPAPESLSCHTTPSRPQNDEQENGEPSESSDSEPDEDSNDNLQHLEAFILNSAAIKLLRERLRIFVRPPLQKIKSTGPEAGKNAFLPSRSTWEFEFAEFPEVLDMLDNKEDNISIIVSDSRGEPKDPSLFSWIKLLFSRQTNQICEAISVSMLDNTFEADTSFASILQARYLMLSLALIRKQFQNMMKQTRLFVQNKIKPQLPGFMPHVKPGQIRIELTCKCGQIIIDDYTEQTQGGIARFQESMSAFAPEVKRTSYLTQMVSKITTKIPVRIIFDFSVRPDESRGKTLLRFSINVIRTFGFIILGIYIRLLNRWEESEFFSYRDRELFKYRVGLVGLAAIGLVILEIYIRTLPSSISTLSPIDERDTRNKSRNLPAISASSSQASTNSGRSLVSTFNSLRKILSFKGKQTSDSERGLPLHSLPTPTPTIGTIVPEPAILPSPEILFLLLCYSSGRYATRLLQLNLYTLNAKCDQSLFAILRANYLSMRNSMFSVKRLQSIKFVRFEMYQSELVDVRKTDDIPPPDHVDYRYMPTPLDVIPPVGEGMMMHRKSLPKSLLPFYFSIYGS